MGKTKQPPLEISTFMAFSEEMEDAHQNSYYDIETNYTDVDKDRTIVTITPIHVNNPTGRAESWKVEYVKKEVVGDTAEIKALRVHYKITTHGDSRVIVAGLNFSGIIIAGNQRTLTT